jgi:hypothetical protein
MSRPSRRRSRGFILGYILMALILLGVVTAGLSRLRDEQAGAEQVERARQTLSDNLGAIRSQVMLCAAANSTNAAGLVAAMPLSADTEDGDLLVDVACPAFGGDGVKLFDGSSAVFVPQPPPGFEPWRYVNQLPGGGSGDIFAYTSTSDATGVAAVSRLSKSVSADQLQVTGGAGGATTVTYFLRKAPLS